MSIANDENTVLNVSDGIMILVSGGCRSGKSRWAEYLIKEQPKVCYIATGSYNISDKDWIDRINIHRNRRPKDWKTVEASQDLARHIKENSIYSILIDSLGGFVSSNLNMQDDEWDIQVRNLVAVLVNHKNTIIIVIEQTGLGVVPETKLGNIFRDRIGSLSQQLESIAESSWLVLQGRAIDLKLLSVAIP